MSGDVAIEGVKLPEFSSHEDLYRWIADATKSLSKEQLRQISQQSITHYKNEVADALVGELSVDNLTIDERSIVLDPEDFMRNMNAMMSARKQLLEWKRTAPRGEAIDDAEVAYLDIFLAKLNEQLAKAIPTVDRLRDQARSIGDSELHRRAEELVSPAIATVLDDSERKRRLFRSLDFLRNGIGYTENGNPTAVSSLLEVGAATEAQGGDFTVEQMKRMKETMIQPEDMKRFFEGILRQANMLSQEDSGTWSPDRKHRAADGLFQVVINPTKATFAVDSTSGVYQVSSEPRSLYDVIIVGGFHELEHI